MSVDGPRLIAALIRHGDYHQLPDAPSAHQPFPLNADGERQARQSVPVLQELARQQGWQAHPVIDSSRLLRGWQTARLIGDGLDGLYKIESFDELAERGLGSAANLTVGQIEDVLRQDPRYEQPPDNWKADSRYRLPLQGAESLLEAGERIAGHLRHRMRQLVGQLDRDTVKLFVGHGAAFRHAAYHLGVLEFEQIARLSMHHCRPVFIEYLPSAKWRQVAGEWKQRQQGDAQLD